MKCPNCNREIPNEAKFCLHCGTKIVKDSTTECPSCHHVIPSDSKFCPDCGTKIAKDVISNGFDIDVESYNKERDIDNLGNELSLYFDFYGLTLGKSTQQDVKNLGGVFVNAERNGYDLPNGHYCWFDDQLKIKGLQIHALKNGGFNDLPLFYRNLGIHQGINRRDFRELFIKLGFSIYESPTTDASSIYGRSPYTVAYRYCTKSRKYLNIKMTSFEYDCASRYDWITITLRTDYGI